MSLFNKKSILPIVLVNILIQYLFVLNTYGQCPLDLSELSQPTTEDLLIHLPMDNNLENLGNGSYTATLHGGNFVNGVDGNGISFDGQNDYIRIEPSLTLTENFTITCWIKLNSTQGDMGLFSIREQCQNTYRGFSMAQLSINDFQTPGLTYQVNKTEIDCTTGSGGDRYNNPDIELLTDDFMFVAVTVQNNASENRIVTLYVNCKDFVGIQTLNQPSYEPFENGHTFITTIGAASTVPGFHKSIDGLMDDFRLYDRILSFEEIQANYRSIKPMNLAIENFEDCNYYSSNLLLFPAEIDVTYELINLADQSIVSQIQPSSCEAILHTGPVIENQTFGIRAINNISDCQIDLDTFIEISPEKTFYYEAKEINLCEGDTVLSGNIFIWQDTIVPDTVNFSNLCDSVYLVSYDFQPPLDISIGSDTTLCMGAIYTIDLTDYDDIYFEWSDGAIGPVYSISETGSYWVKYQDPFCSILDSDTVSVNFIDCNCEVFIPNVFTPNGDQLNDKFGPIFNCPVEEYELTIFNRWGGLMFKTKNPNEQWDGRLRNEPETQATYFYVLKFKKYNRGQQEIRKGTVTLLL